MRGHVRKRGGTWAVVYDEGRDDGGRRVQRWKGGYATRREAEEALTKILSSLAMGEYVRPTADTFGGFLDEWLEAIEAQVRPSTLASYRMMVDKHVKPRVGTVKLQKLTALKLNAAYAAMLRDGSLHTKTKRGLSPRTVRYAHTIVQKALADAVAWNLIVRNVAEAANPPKGARPAKRTWTADELRRFLAHVADDRLYAAYLLAPRPGCAAARSSASPGRRSTSPAPNSPCRARSSRSTTRCSSRSRRRRRAAGRSRSTRPRSLRSAATRTGSSRSGS